MTPSQLNQRLRSFWEKTGLKRLERRERMILGFGAAFLVCFFFVGIVLLPCLNADKRLTRSLADKKQAVVKIAQLQKEFRRLQGQAGAARSRLSERAPGFTLFSFLEEQAGKAEVKRQIQYMKPSSTGKDGAERESLVEMKLQRIPLNRLVEFLKLVESSRDVVMIKHISIQQSGAESSLLDVVLQVFTFVDKT